MQHRKIAVSNRYVSKIEWGKCQSNKLNCRKAQVIIQRIQLFGYSAFTVLMLLQCATVYFVDVPLVCFAFMHLILKYVWKNLALLSDIMFE